MSDEAPPKRTRQEIDQEYANQCMVLGNLVYQNELFSEQKQMLVTQMRILNEEAAELLPKPEVPSVV